MFSESGNKMGLVRILSDFKVSGINKKTAANSRRIYERKYISTYESMIDYLNGMTYVFEDVFYRIM